MQKVLKIRDLLREDDTFKNATEIFGNNSLWLLVKHIIAAILVYWKILLKSPDDLQSGQIICVQTILKKNKCNSFFYNIFIEEWEYNIYLNMGKSCIVAWELTMIMRST